MIKHLMILMLTLFLLSISACERAYLARTDLIEYIDTLIAQQHYSEADRILSQVNEQHPDYAELQLRLQKVQHYIQAYETGLINQANLLEEQERWTMAVSMYASGLDAFPNSTRLKTEKQAFEKRYQYALEKLQIELILNETRKLLDEQSIYEKILAVTPDLRHLKHSLQRNRTEQLGIAEELLVFVQHAIQHADDAFAYKCLTMVNRIQPTDQTQQLLGSLQKKISLKEKQLVETVNAADKTTMKKATDNAIASNQNPPRKEDALLLRAYMEAVRSGRLPQAIRHMQKLQQIQPRDVNLEKLKRDLDSIIESKIEVEYDLAIRFYSQGDIEQALSIWKSIQSFDPDNTKLKSDINRAERVLANIRRISKQQPD